MLERVTVRRSQRREEVYTTVSRPRLPCSRVPDQALGIEFPAGTENVETPYPLPEGERAVVGLFSCSAMKLVQTQDAFRKSGKGAKASADFPAFENTTFFGETAEFR